MKKITSIFLLALVINGCSQKHSHPIQLNDAQNESNINIQLLDRDRRYVPKDKFFYHKNWHYKQSIYYKYNFLRNDEIADTFYLAHHATRIYIKGNKHTIVKYKNYFLNNQVEAKIVLIPMRNYRHNLIRIDYFSLSPHAIIPNRGNKATASTVKNIIKANSDIVEIPKNFTKEK